MDNQKEEVMYDVCANCHTLNKTAECDRCLRLLCVNCMVITKEGNACVDCFPARFSASYGLLGETLYVITSQNYS